MALHDGFQVLAEFSWISARHHSVEAPPLLSAMLERTGLRAADLRAIALPAGPGSYTGLRIGMSLAKGLALSTQPPLPLIAIPTLDITAAGQPPGDGLLCVVVEAGRGKVNAGLYRWEAGWQAQDAPFNVRWVDLPHYLDGVVRLAGEIDVAGRAILAEAVPRVMIADAASNLRRAAVLAQLALAHLDSDFVDAGATLAPLYDL